MAEPASPTSPNTPSGTFAPVGEDRYELLHDLGMTLRHGSSLNLMVKASTLINAEFDSDPTADWIKHESGKRHLYYVVVEDPAANDEVVCALRAMADEAAGAADGVGRIIIEYVHTSKNRRGMGYAERVTRFVINLAAVQKTDCYVLSTENAAGYWMRFGFILEQDQRLNDEFNDFTDTHLLKLPSNKSGSTDTTYIPLDRPAEEEEEEGEEDEEGEEGEEEEEDDGEAALQQAIAASLMETAPVATSPPPQSQAPTLTAEEEELQRAIQMSME
eukprot:NODE_4522_length_1052_cov_113.994618_g4320_i0.p1 GENE.NODE_4522_length_1052_cov_113.994618_g4320_i0~~NODE_4522_length_1052_cov_113.994618_g4320_i0.p1  ORF type:complete len:274 (+),score=68.34 NODE_4522_length_1052_cov_113.994618_g4320_i0:107-928(+)